MSITDCKKKNQNLIITNLASNKNWLLIVLFSLIPLLQNQLIAGSNSSFCADWAEENTSWFASKYRYEYSKNYNYCLSNANYLIEQYEWNKLPFWEQRRIKAEEKRAREAELESQRAKEARKMKALLRKQRQEENQRKQRAIYINNLKNNINQILE